MSKAAIRPASVPLAPAPEAPVEPRAAPPGGHAFRLNSPAGGTLRFVHWRALRAPQLGAAVVLPGYGEFVEKYHETVGDLLTRGYSVYVMDWFGQGMSSRPLANRHKIHVADFRRHVADLAKLVDTALPPRLETSRLLLAHSMGAHLALRFLHDHPNEFDLAVLTSPLIELHYGGAPRRLSRWAAETACAVGLGRAYCFGMGDYDAARRRFEGNRLTSDRRRFLDQHAWIATRPRLAVGGPTFGWLRAVQRSIKRVQQPWFAAKIRTPVLAVAAEHDRVVSTAAAQRFVKSLPHGTYISVVDARHEILMENDTIRALFWQRVDGFIALYGRRAAA